MLCLTIGYKNEQLNNYRPQVLLFVQLFYPNKFNILWWYSFKRLWIVFFLIKNDLFASWMKVKFDFSSPESNHPFISGQTFLRYMITEKLYCLQTLLNIFRYIKTIKNMFKCTSRYVICQLSKHFNKNYTIVLDNSVFSSPFSSFSSLDLVNISLWNWIDDLLNSFPLILSFNFDSSFNLILPLQLL